MGKWCKKMLGEPISGRFSVNSYGFNGGNERLRPVRAQRAPADFALTTKQFDAKAELYYFYARLEPETGAFISRTPLAATQEGLYRFCNNNPARLADPSGLFGAFYDPTTPIPAGIINSNTSPLIGWGGAWGGEWVAGFGGGSGGSGGGGRNCPGWICGPVAGPGGPPDFLRAALGARDVAGVGVGFIPVVGPIKDAVNDFRNGHPVWGIVNLGLAALDVTPAAALPIPPIGPIRRALGFADDVPLGFVDDAGEALPHINPFEGKSPGEIDDMLRGKGFQPSGPDPINGKGGYVNPRTGRSYHIDVNNRFGEPPHVDINRPRDYKGPLKKRKSSM